MLSLPDDLVEEILLKLPINYLYQCRCLSKSLLNQIQSPFLIRAQTKKYINNKPLIVICGGADYPNTLYSMDFHNVENQTVARLMNLDYPTWDSEKLMNIVGICNGLICIENTNRKDFNACYDYPSSNTVFTLWNPFTGIYRIVPDKSDNTPKSWSRSISGCFDSSCYFGYDHVKDDYHVVRVTMPRSDPEQPWLSNIEDYNFVLDVYSLKNNAWRKIMNQEFQKEWVVYAESGVFISGTLYLIVKPKKNDNSPMILGFDFATQTFRLVVLTCTYRGIADVENIWYQLEGRFSFKKCVWSLVSNHVVWSISGEDDVIEEEKEDLWNKIFEFQTWDSEFLIKLLPYSVQQILGMVSCDKMIWCDSQTNLPTDISVEDPECLMQREAYVCSRSTVSPFLV